MSIFYGYVCGSFSSNGVVNCAKAWNCMPRPCVLVIGKPCEQMWESPSPVQRVEVS